MNRRELVRLLGLGVAGLAGCGTFGSDEQPPPTPSDGSDGGSAGSGPTVSNPIYPFNAGAASEFEFEESDSGTVIIRVPVENTRAEPYSGELRLTVDVGDGQQTLTTSIQLAGNESTKIPVELDTDWDDWSPNFGNVEFSQGTPVDESSG